MSAEAPSSEPKLDIAGPRPSASVLYEAEAWLQRFENGDLDKAAALRLLRWLKQDASHLRAFKMAAAGKGDRGVRDVLFHIDEANRGPALAAPRRRARWPRVLAIALGLIVGCLGGFVIHQDETLTSYPKRLFADHAAGSGTTQAVQLEDGSNLLLGSETAVNVRFETSERFVEFLGGEALFTVGSADSRPFVVRAPTVLLEAIGTRFVLRDVGGEAILSVQEGAVRVEPRTRPGHGTLVTAGLEVVVNETVGVPQPLGRFGAEGWRNGLFPRRAWTFSELVDEYRRYTAGVIISIGALETEEDISGAFRSNESFEALGELGGVWGFRVRSCCDGNILIIHPELER